MKKLILFLCVLIITLPCLVSCGNNVIIDKNIPESIISKHNQRKIYSYMPLSEFLALLNNAVYIEDSGIRDYELNFEDENNASFTVISTGSYASYDSIVISCTVFYEDEVYSLFNFGVRIELLNNKVNMDIPEIIITRENQKKVYTCMPLGDLLAMFGNPELINSSGSGIAALEYIDQNGAEINIQASGWSNNSSVYNCRISYEGQYFILLDIFLSHFQDDSMSTIYSGSSETDKMFFTIGSVNDKILSDMTLMDVSGGAMGYPASLDEIKKYISGLDIRETILIKDNYEIVAVYDEKENIVLTFAYSYTSKKVYISKENVTYEVNNPEGLRLWLGNLLCQFDYYYTDLKIFWINEITNPRVDLEDGNWYSNSFSFRYERYFGLLSSDTEDIFYSIKGYMNTATDEREMIENLAEAMTNQTYHAIIAYDDLTGYWRVELYGDNVDVLIYLDNAFRILWGCYI